MFQGSIVAIVTPMHTDGSIDHQSLTELIEWHIDSGTHGIVVAGTTGESATLETSEYEKLLEHTVHTVHKRIPVIAGTGSNSTAHTVTNTKIAKKAGVDACLIVTPYYNKPTQAGLIAHYTLAARVGLPIIMYNVPGRTGCDMLPETATTLSENPMIVGMKEATGDVARVTTLRQTAPTLAIFSGDDPTALNAMTQGAQGVISVTANVAPKQMADMCQAALNGDRKTAENINRRLAVLHEKLFIESNPIPTKWALSELGRIPDGIRLPLLPLDNRYHTEIKNALDAVGIKAGVEA